MEYGIRLGRRQLASFDPDTNQFTLGKVSINMNDLKAVIDQYKANQPRNNVRTWQDSIEDVFIGEQYRQQGVKHHHYNMPRQIGVTTFLHKLFRQLNEKEPGSALFVTKLHLLRYLPSLNIPHLSSLNEWDTKIRGTKYRFILFDGAYPSSLQKEILDISDIRTLAITQI